MFLGLLDPDPDPSVKGMDPDPDPAPDLDPSITKQKSKKNLGSYCFVTSFWLFIYENDSKVISKKNFYNLFNVGILVRSMTKIAGSGSASGSISTGHGSADQDPDPYPPQNVMDPQHCSKLFASKMRQLYLE
jgi:hypothetical protein